MRNSSAEFTLQIVSAIALIVAGLCITPTRYVNVLLTGRFLAGCVYGIAHLTTVIHASDITSPKIRNFAVKLIGFVIALSLIVFGWTGVLSNGMLIIHTGKILRALGGFALISVLLSSESIPFLVANLRYEKALVTFTIYAGESVPSPKTISTFDDLKTKVHTELVEPKTLFGPNYIRSECIAVGVRILHLLCSSVPITLLLFSSVNYVFDCFPKLSGFPLGSRWAIFLSARLIYGCVVFLVSNSTKRIRFYSNLAICNGVGLLLVLTPLNTNSYYVNEFAFVIFVTHVLMEFGLNASLYDQIAEKFTYVNRPWVTASIEVIANILQLVLLLLLLLGLNSVVYGITGLGLVVISILLRNNSNKIAVESTVQK